MKLDIFDKNGKVKSTKIELSDDVFGIEPNFEVIKQYIRVYTTNQRQGTVATKGRGEVAGTGRKPWRQKGTGRARVGTIQNPLWRGGGVAHGPKQRPWTLTMPKKMRALAIKSALSSKLANKALKVVEDIEIKEPKTRDFMAILDSLKVEGKVLFVSGVYDRALLKSTTNIKNLNFVNVNELNTFDVFGAKTVVLTKTAVEVLNAKYGGKNETK